MELTLFGLTGGIASGKSSVGRRWRDRGLPVIDADVVARKVVEKGTPGLDAVVRTFGEEYLAADGWLDRRKLGHLVFSQPDMMRKLEAVVWPEMEAETERMRSAIAAEGFRLACYEAAIIVDCGHEDVFRPLVAVTAPEEVRVGRMVKRDRMTREQALDRIRSQVSDERRAEAADFVINSDRPSEETLVEADAVLDSICRWKGLEPGRFR